MIEIPLQQAAIDVVWSVNQFSRGGSPYAWTKTHMVTWYLDESPIRTCDSMQNAEGLVEVFSSYVLPQKYTVTVRPQLQQI